MTINRPSLGNAFSGRPTPDRGSGLGGLLPPPKVDVQKKPQPKIVVEKEQPPQPQLAATTKTKRPNTDDVVSSVGVYLEPEILELIKKQRRRDRAPGENDRQYDEIIVDALALVTLEDLRAHFSVPLLEVSSLLQPRKRRARGIAGVQIQPRLSRGQKATIDSLVTQTGAPSRSALLSAALRLAYMNK